MTDLDKPAGSYHGSPDLLMRDIKLLEDYNLWIQTIMKENNNESISSLPGYPDWIKSRLFWRIRSGKQPLEFAIFYSCQPLRTKRLNA